MVRTAKQTAEALTTIYNEEFRHESMEGFVVTWPDFRALAGGRRIDKTFLADINRVLASDNYVVAPFERFLAIVSESDLSGLRKARGRIIEQYMPEEDEDIEIGDLDDIDCDDDIDIDED